MGPESRLFPEMRISNKQTAVLVPVNPFFSQQFKLVMQDIDLHDTLSLSCSYSRGFQLHLHSGNAISQCLATDAFTQFVDQ